MHSVLLAPHVLAAPSGHPPPVCDREAAGTTQAVYACGTHRSAAAASVPVFCAASSPATWGLLLRSAASSFAAEAPANSVCGHSTKSQIAAGWFSASSTSEHSPLRGCLLCSLRPLLTCQEACCCQQAQAQKQLSPLLHGCVVVWESKNLIWCPTTFFCWQALCSNQEKVVASAEWYDGGGGMDGCSCFRAAVERNHREGWFWTPCTCLLNSLPPASSPLPTTSSQCPGVFGDVQLRSYRQQNTKGSTISARQ